MGITKTSAIASNVATIAEVTQWKLRMTSDNKELKPNTWYKCDDEIMPESFPSLIKNNQTDRIIIWQKRKGPYFGWANITRRYRIPDSNEWVWDCFDDDEVEAWMYAQYDEKTNNGN